MNKTISTHTLLERFEMHASTKFVAKKVYNLVKDKDILRMSFSELYSIKGLGRNGAILCAEVAADMLGKK